MSDKDYIERVRKLMSDFWAEFTEIVRGAGAMTDSERVEQFYVPSTAAWRKVAEMHLGDGGVVTTLACALHTLCDAYEHARSCGSGGTENVEARVALMGQVIQPDCSTRPANFD